jgi:hydroxymethylpyrimidine/phosphomethylpyrimidine kinase
MHVQNVMMRIGVGYQIGRGSKIIVAGPTRPLNTCLAASHGAGCSRSAAFVAEEQRQKKASKQVLAAGSEIEAAV